MAELLLLSSVAEALWRSESSHEGRVRTLISSECFLERTNGKVSDQRVGRGLIT